MFSLVDTLEYLLYARLVTKYRNTYVLQLKSTSDSTEICLIIM